MLFNNMAKWHFKRHFKCHLKWYFK